MIAMGGGQAVASQLSTMIQAKKSGQRPRDSHIHSHKPVIGCLDILVLKIFLHLQGPQIN